MDSFNLLNALNKGGVSQEEEITLIVDNTEVEFDILGVSNSVGKKSLIIKMKAKDEKALTTGDSSDQKKAKVDPSSEAVAPGKKVKVKEKDIVSVTETDTPDVTKLVDEVEITKEEK